MPFSVAPAAGSAAGAAVGSAAGAAVGSAAAGAAVGSAAAGAAVGSAAAGAAVGAVAAGAVVGVAAGAPPQAARIMVNTRQRSVSDQVRLRIIVCLLYGKIYIGVRCDEHARGIASGNLYRKTGTCGDGDHLLSDGRDMWMAIERYDGDAAIVSDVRG